ncbi:MAG: pentapeptide repeat-containing protein, partial [Ktedonobacteraceae bacterium]
LLGAHLEGANLEGAHLEGANLVGASLRGKPVPADYLKRVRQWDKDVLTPANLQGAFFDSKTTMEDIILGEETFGYVSLADAHWGGVNLSVVDWDAVTRLGDERRALQTTWLFNYQQAVRAYRQLAAALREQGLNEEAAYFAYRGEVLQRGVLWRQMLQLRRRGRRGLPRLVQKMVSYLLTWPLDLFAGYGYKPMRAFITYLLVVVGFMLLYTVIGTAQSSHLPWSQLFIVSITAFHGGAFSFNQFAPDSPQAFVSAIETFVGFLVEVSLIAAFAQRFFRK